MDKTRTPKNSANRARKAGVMAEMQDKIGKSKAMVFTNYRGLTHKQLEGFKKEIKKSEAEFAVTKNTLLKLSLEKANLETGESKNFDQPTGTMYLYGDIVGPLKALAKMIKELEKPEIKFGLLDGKLLTSAEILKLSTLPSRETLLTQLVVTLKSPIQGLHRALEWNMQKFVMTLGAISNNKGKTAQSA